VAQRIITRAFSEIPEVSRILLAVSKLNPPIGGDVEAVTVELEEYRTNKYLSFIRIEYFFKFYKQTFKL
jgi:hypothetical protein